MNNYFAEVTHLLKDVYEKEMPAIKQAAMLIAESVNKGGILQLFGCGHSHLLAQEAFYRAGGLVPAKPISIEPLMLHSGALTSSKNEKDPNFVEKHIESFDFHDGDVLLIISTSGRNAVPIDVALLAKKLKITTISLQSLNYSRESSRHLSHKRLEDVVDVIIDTHVPVGDGVLYRGDLQYGPVSTTIGSCMLNALISEVVEVIMEKEERAPVFSSANVDKAGKNNEALIEQYQKRVNFN